MWKHVFQFLPVIGSEDLELPLEAVHLVIFVGFSDIHRCAYKLERTIFKSLCLHLRQYEVYLWLPHKSKQAHEVVQDQVARFTVDVFPGHHWCERPGPFRKA